jgi:hypothetical protein
VENERDGDRGKAAGAANQIGTSYEARLNPAPMTGQVIRPGFAVTVRGCRASGYDSGVIDQMPVWDGITQRDVFTEDGLRDRLAFADAARGQDWPRVFAFLEACPDWINVTRPGGTSLFAPLHQAAYGGAPRDVIERLVALGAWRTLRNARGERPLDVLDWRRHPDLVGPLEPRLRRGVPAETLRKLQAHFHAVIRGRADDLVTRYEVRLPELEPLLELGDTEVWFAVPGFYGGFRYRLEQAGTNARLVAESFCRISGGSGQRHEITADGSRLVAEGFV